MRLCWQSKVWEGKKLARAGEVWQWDLRLNPRSHLGRFQDFGCDLQETGGLLPGHDHLDANGGLGHESLIDGGDAETQGSAGQENAEHAFAFVPGSANVGD